MSELLFHHLFESTLFSFLLIFLTYLLQRGAATRHAAWLIAILKFVIPSVLLTSAGAQIAFFWPASSWLLSAVAKVSAQFFALLSLLSITPPHSIFAIWAFGTAGLFSLWFIRLRNNRVPLVIATEEERMALARASRRLQISGFVQLRSSQTVTEPSLRGIWDSTITVPEGLHQRLTASEFEAVLLHELAHARRRDNFTGAFVHCLVCLFWFHPFFWFAERRIRVECERACDELVLACGITPQIYISCIFKVCRFHLFESVPGMSAINGSDLKRRLRLISSYRSCRPVTYIPRLLMSVAALLMLMLPIAGGYCEQCASNDMGTISKEVRRR